MFNPLKLIPTGITTAKDKADTKVASIALRAPIGLFMLNTGLEKFQADKATAEFLQNMASTGLPFVKEMDAENFAKLIAASETSLGAALLLPFVPNRLAGLGLSTFAAGLLSMYFRNPAMTQSDGIRPTQEGLDLSKNTWLAAIGAALLALPKK
ncbi:DoxX family membrane protein [Corynebacterium sp. UBA2622]|uniref:DoxX family membrane protein n=1 Tax=Corynebacterium sp. UBA2622 TaxID=1946393 RepID=UPI0025BF7230|nr:DoxX family membrane protein [Corynebacterium sp. UBA2622]